MAEDKTIIMPDNQNGWGNIPLALTLPWLGGGYGYGNGYGFGGGLLGGGGFLTGILGGILGGLIPGFVQNGGFGYGTMGGGAAAASLGSQATANNNTETILRAIDGTDSDIRLLATTLNSDIDSVRLAVNTVQGAIATVGANLGLTGQQVINAIQQGNMGIAQQLCQCCCEMRQLTVEQGYQNQIRTLEQTNALGTAINANGQRNIDAIADLKTTMVQEFCNVKEREMQSKIDALTANNAQLRSQIDNANQTNAIAAMLAPIASEVESIKLRMPQTVPVTYPNLSVVNNTPAGCGCGCNGGAFNF